MKMAPQGPTSFSRWARCAQQRGLSHPRLAGELDRRARLEGAGCKRDLLLATQQRREVAWEAANRQGAQPRNRPLLQSGVVDDRPVLGVDLDYVLADGDLSRDDCSREVGHDPFISVGWWLGGWLLTPEPQQLHAYVPVAG